MNTQINTQKATQAGLRKLGLAPCSRDLMDMARIVAVDANSDNPLFVQFDNGAICAVGGLSESQQSQIPNLLPELIGVKVFVKYSALNTLGQPVNAHFITLLVEFDDRPEVETLKGKLREMGAISE